MLAKRKLLERRSFELVEENDRRQQQVEQYKETIVSGIWMKRRLETDENEEEGKVYVRQHYYDKGKVTHQWKEKEQCRKIKQQK